MSTVFWLNSFSRSICFDFICNFTVWPVAACICLLTLHPNEELTQILLLLFLPFSHQEEGCRRRKCGGQVQPVEAPQGSAEHGAGPADGPVALRRRRPRPPGQAVRPSAQRGLPAGQELLHR